MCIRDRFTAPDAETKLAFVLRANDGALLSSPSRVDVLVKASGPEDVPGLSGGGCGCHTASDSTESKLGSLALGAMVLGLVRRRRAKG